MLCYIRILYQEGAGTKKGRGRKKEMKLRRRSLPYTTESAKIDHRWKLKEVGIDDEDKESIDEGNNIRYLRMNWIYTTTECQVQIENYMLLRKLSGDDQNPKGTILNVNNIRHTNSRV
jgi:hypothetical protein